MLGDVVERASGVVDVAVVVVDVVERASGVVGVAAATSSWVVGASGVADVVGDVTEGASGVAVLTLANRDTASALQMFKGAQNLGAGTRQKAESLRKMSS